MNKKSAFTLIELLMVIAIIGILAGILIPTVGQVKRQANVAASKSQLSQYVSAMQMFKGEYGYYPFSGQVDVNGGGNFIAVLSGSPYATAAEAGNRRGLGFHSFSESEYWTDDSGVVSESVLSDRFGNTNIYMFVDEKGDGVISPAPLGYEVAAPDGGTLRTEVTAWVNGDKENGYPGYSLWD